jgi:NADH-quinone oxidoreductase subunit H
MLAYEIALGVSLIGVVVCYETLDLGLMIERQGELLWGWLPKWGIFLQPLGCLVFLTAALAETKRVPFDLPEGESEIIGYFVEYSGMKFGLFFMTDFIETVLVACLAATLFFGGWQVPYLHPDGFHFPWGATAAVGHLAYVGIGIASFSLKVLAFCWLFMAIRWTLPRFRYDQLMRLGWQYLFPIALVNVLVTAGILALI